jgi:hypothetical protein
MPIAKQRMCRGNSDGHYSDTPWREVGVHGVCGEAQHALRLACGLAYARGGDAALHPQHSSSPKKLMQINLS